MQDNEDRLGEYRPYVIVPFDLRAFATPCEEAHLNILSIGMDWAVEYVLSMWEIFACVEPQNSGIEELYQQLMIDLYESFILLDEHETYLAQYDEVFLMFFVRLYKTLKQMMGPLPRQRLVQYQERTYELNTVTVMQFGVHDCVLQFNYYLYDPASGAVQPRPSSWLTPDAMNLIAEGSVSMADFQKTYAL